jgi:hypothetical protein
MKRIAWNLLCGLGAAALLVAAPAALAGGEKEKSKAGSTAQGATQQDASSSESAAKGDERAATSMTGSPSASSENQLTGKIEKYDRAEKTLTLDGSEKKLKLGDDVQVTKGGQMVSPGDLQEGDEVRASFSGAESGETVEVTAIEVMPSDALGTGSSGESRSGGTSVGTDTGGGSTGTGSTGSDTSGTGTTGSDTSGTGTKSGQ